MPFKQNQILEFCYNQSWGGKQPLYTFLQLFHTQNALTQCGCSQNTVPIQLPGTVGVYFLTRFLTRYGAGRKNFDVCYDPIRTYKNESEQICHFTEMKKCFVTFQTTLLEVWYMFPRRDASGHRPSTGRHFYLESYMFIFRVTSIYIKWYCFTLTEIIESFPFSFTFFLSEAFFFFKALIYLFVWGRDSVHASISRGSDRSREKQAPRGLNPRTLGS